ncbi:hypothetical protein DPEC_G00245040 [Dallia pectoralis]|uniref:Uncharacterized protein n=1 Tax=Dallia pectoralis TaxID=75939 RepID=A0ACC2FVW7_DALPE|nr:hypothetical protein DPEC_G00245040 [Dallia pectoralis]
MASFRAPAAPNEHPKHQRPCSAERVGTAKREVWLPDKMPRAPSMPGDGPDTPTEPDKPLRAQSQSGRCMQVIRGCRSSGCSDWLTRLLRGREDCRLCLSKVSQRGRHLVTSR